MKATLRLIWALGLLVFLWVDHAAYAICNASQTCWDGSTVSCQGTSDCRVGSDFVVCDGFAHSCPFYCDTITCSDSSVCSLYCRGLNPRYHGGCGSGGCCYCF